MRVAAPAMALLCLIGCSDEPLAPSPRGPAFLSLRADTLELSRGESIVVEPIALHADSTTFTKPALRWLTGDASIATVDSTGLVTAHADGAVVVRATAAPDSVADSVVLLVRSSFTDVAVAAAASCGLSPDGRLWCWGSDAGAVLGNGSAGASAVPVAVEGNRRWRAVTAQRAHVCAITTTDEAWCWGTASEGTLGDGLLSGLRPAPSPVAGGRRWRSIAAGSATTCGVTWEQEAWCWGRGTEGALGSGTTSHSSTPSQVIGGARYSEVGTGGSTSCGLTLSGSVFCWGAGYGSTPVPVPGSHVFVDLTVGSDMACALKVGGDTWCWGVSDWNLRRGDAAESTMIPSQPRDLPKFSSISASFSHLCGLEQVTGRAWCWGDNGSGQLGRPQHGTGFFSYDAMPVAGGHSFVRIAAATAHTCGVTAAGSAWCWGAGTTGQLGDGLLSSSSTPRRVRHPR